MLLYSSIESAKILNLQNPIFICGALRSGSTLLHLMLDHHPGIKNPGEFDFMFDQIGDDGTFPDIAEYWEFLDRSRIFKAKNLTIDKYLTFEELVVSFVEQLSHKNKLLAINVHRNFNRIPYVFPEANYVHLLRDPRDVARSSIEMGWRGNVYYGVDHWLETEQSWDKLVSKIDPKQYATIHYEQLIENPEAELTNLCRFMGIPYASSMLDYPLKSSYKKPDKSLAQQWKRKLAVREIQYVETKAIDLMQRRGYSMSGHPLIRVGEIEKLNLALQSKWHRIKHGCNRYGTAIYIYERLTKRLGLSGLNKKYVFMKHEIDRKKIK